MRTSIFVIVLWMAGCVAGPPAKGPVSRAEVIPAEFRDEFNRRLPEVKFEGNSIGDAIDFVSDVAACGFHINWHAIEPTGISKDTPITLELKNATLEEAIKTILASADGGRHLLTFGIANHVVISTPAEIENDLRREERTLAEVEAELRRKD